ncbi:hypothetical protein RDI58_002975 [Solanum bulbocastanum]|uniref:Glutathione transferase n=1 Tax=Solanum bulbocastanum TaxID=147425 RepID=A0AAN8UEG0_SOLBU
MAGSGEESKKLQLYSYWRSSCAFRVQIALNLKEYLKLNPLGYVPTLVDGDAVIADSFAILMYLEEMYPQRALLPQDCQKRAINYQAANIVSANIQPLQNLSVLVSLNYYSIHWSYKKYIHEKVGPNETTPWVQSHITKGFEEIFFSVSSNQPIKQGQLFAIINIPAKFALAIDWLACSCKLLLLRFAFAALEKLLKDYAGKYATGGEVYMADLFLAPQIHAAIKLFEVDMNQFPTLLRVFEAYQELPAFQDAMPEKQPDATC